MAGWSLAGSIFGALVAAFLLSRLFLWLVRKRLSGTSAILTAHGITLAVIFVVAGFGFSDDGSFVASAVLIYIVPVVLFLVIDLMYARAARERPDSSTQ